MPQKRRSQSFDSMIKFFLKQYNFATKQDINRLAKKIDSLEKRLIAMAGTPGKSAGKQAKQKTASDVVLNIISEIRGGANFADIKAGTDYDDKKLRNIIYRLTKQGKIQRKKRGVYVAV